jgi:hypothetical protein
MRNSWQERGCLPLARYSPAYSIYKGPQPIEPSVAESRRWQTRKMRASDLYVNFSRCRPSLTRAPRRDTCACLDNDQIAPASTRVSAGNQAWRVTATKDRYSLPPQLSSLLALSIQHFTALQSSASMIDLAMSPPSLHHTLNSCHTTDIQSQPSPSYPSFFPACHTQRNQRPSLTHKKDHNTEKNNIPTPCLSFPKSNTPYHRLGTSTNNKQLQLIVKQT